MDLEDAETRKRILDFVRSYHQQNQKVPSIREIIENLNINRYTLYSIFPEGIKEICKALSLPVPEERISSTMEANLSKKAVKAESPFEPISLTVEQQKQLNAIAFLERLDVQLTIDKLIETYRLLKEKLRKWDLSLNELLQAAKILEESKVDPNKACELIQEGCVAEENVKKLKNEEREASLKLRKLQKEHEKLEKEINELQQQRQELVDKMKTLEEKKSQIEEGINKYEEEIEERGLSLGQFFGFVSKFNSLQELETKIKEREEEIESLEEKLKRLKTTNVFEAYEKGYNEGKNELIIKLIEDPEAVLNSLALKTLFP